MHKILTALVLITALSACSSVSRANLSPAEQQQYITTINNTLVPEMMQWVARNTELSIPHNLPNVIFVSNVGENTDVANKSGTIAGAYEQWHQTIKLPLWWNINNGDDLASLLHEVVHHMQYQSTTYARKMQCGNAYERLAYNMEDKYLTTVQHRSSPFYKAWIDSESACK